MNPEQPSADNQPETEDGWPDVYGEAPPVDDRQLSTRSAPEET
ncbi:hypothetical protein ACF1BB_27150 [Streptomyces griseoluteus]